MAAARGVFNLNTKLKALELEVIRALDELDLFLKGMRQNLLGKLARMKESLNRNVELDKAMEQLKIVRDTAVKVMISKILGGELNTLRREFDAKIRVKKEMKVAVENLELLNFVVSLVRFAKD